ncbi:MAG TPA: hypothetical protein VFO17_01030 [Acidimicrobiia bacterium]|nr:hypothetical protein [Acidimicrobiia bacterium]
MTATSPQIATWAVHPMGKAARIAIAVGGSATAVLLLMLASVVQSGSWALVVLGVGLAALSVRAARVPSAVRLTLVAVAMLAIPLTLQTF